jgi:hypothetical protein
MKNIIKRKKNCNEYHITIQLDRNKIRIKRYKH